MRIKLNYLLVAIVSIFLTYSIFSQTSEEVVIMNSTSRLTSQYADEVVAEFDGHEITLDEFEKAYTKNAGSTEAARGDSLDEYRKFLDLYVSYKMKLRSAYVRGYYDDVDLNNELNEYKQQVGVSYIEEKNIVAPGMKRFYEQRGEEVRASHIMIRIDSSAEASKIKMQSILDSIKNGASFGDMVVKYSEDNFSKNNGGDIYWFTSGQIIPSFENAAYNTPVGEIYPEIVKSKFGYHIIKVTDRQKRVYKVSASHILIKTESDGENDSNKARRKVNLVYNQIKAGAPFDSLAIKYSDDKGSAVKGGDLGYFQRRQMVQPFDEAVFKLTVGEISPIVKTRFGFHIIKLTDVQEYPSFEEEIENIRDLYKKSRYQNDYDEYINELKQKYNYSVNEALIAQFSKEENQITLNEEYSSDKNYTDYKNDVIISMDNNVVTFDSLVAYIYRKTDNQGKKLSLAILDKEVGNYGNELLLKTKSSELETTDPEFANLMADYRNGIYIFKLQEDEVWNKVKVDSTQLRKIYENTKENYKTEELVNFSEFFTTKKEDIDKYYNMLKEGESSDSLIAKNIRHNKEHVLKRANDSKLSAKANSLTNVGEYSVPFKFNKGWSMVRLNKRIDSRTKIFEEALPELSSSYQESESKRLEAAFNSSLKELYKPSYFYNELIHAFEQQNN